MARHRAHSVAFERRVAPEFLAGETLQKRHEPSRDLIRAWRRSWSGWRTSSA